MKKLVAILSVIFAIAAPASAKEVRLMLDWFPNVDHLPLYVARERGYFAGEELEVEFLSPSDTSDPLKLAAAKAVELGISYQPQTIVAASEGIPIKVAGRLIGHPLTTLLYLEGRGIKKPKDLEGKKIGYTVPSVMDVLTEAFAKINGISRYQLIHVGFTIVQSLVSGKVDAVSGGYRNYEFVELRQEGYKPAFFAFEEHGIPEFDELVMVTSAEYAAQNEEALHSFRRAIQRAIDDVRRDPEEALSLYFKALPEAPKELEREVFRLTLPLYAQSQLLDIARWQRFADFASEFGLIKSPIDVNKLLWSGGVTK
jgi:putative hydroxymethylpyrimidine transport system substrate-binding protein